MGVVVGVVEPAISLYTCWCLCDRSWCCLVVGEGSCIFVCEEGNGFTSFYSTFGGAA